MLAEGKENQGGDARPMLDWAVLYYLPYANDLSRCAEPILSALRAGMQPTTLPFSPGSPPPAPPASLYLSVQVKRRGTPRMMRCTYLKDGEECTDGGSRGEHGSPVSGSADSADSSSLEEFIRSAEKDVAEATAGRGARNWFVAILGHGGAPHQVCPDEGVSSEGGGDKGSAGGGGGRGSGGGSGSGGSDSGGGDCDGGGGDNLRWMGLDGVGTAVGGLHDRTGGAVRLLYLQNCCKSTALSLHATKRCAQFILASQPILGAPNEYYTFVLRWLIACGGQRAEGPGAAAGRAAGVAAAGVAAVERRGSQKRVTFCTTPASCTEKDTCMCGQSDGNDDSTSYSDRNDRNINGDGDGDCDGGGAGGCYGGDVVGGAELARQIVLFEDTTQFSLLTCFDTRGVDPLLGAFDTFCDVVAAAFDSCESTASALDSRSALDASMQTEVVGGGGSRGSGSGSGGGGGGGRGGGGGGGNGGAAGEGEKEEGEGSGSTVVRAALDRIVDTCLSEFSICYLAPKGTLTDQYVCIVGFSRCLRNAVAEVVTDSSKEEHAVVLSAYTTLVAALDDAVVFRALTPHRSGNGLSHMSGLSVYWPLREGKVGGKTYSKASDREAEAAGGLALPSGGIRRLRARMAPAVRRISAQQRAASQARKVAPKRIWGNSGLGKGRRSLEDLEAAEDVGAEIAADGSNSV